MPFLKFIFNNYKIKKRLFDLEAILQISTECNYCNLIKEFRVHKQLLLIISLREKNNQ